MDMTKKAHAIKKLQREMKEEKKAEIVRKKQITLERKKAAEERQRLEEAKAQVRKIFRLSACHFLTHSHLDGGKEGC
jgi:rRNA-processing protein CGR1